MCCGPPENKWAPKSRTADEIYENGVETPFSNPGVVLLDGDYLELHIDTNVVQLFLNFETDAFKQTEVGR